MYDGEDFLVELAAHTRRAVRMRKFLGLLAFAVLVAKPAFAQSQQQNPPSTQAQQGSSAPPQAQQGSSSPTQAQPQNPPAAQKRTPASARSRKKLTPSKQKIDVAAGGTFNRFTAPAGYYLDMAGWTASADYNIFRWLAAQVEGSGDYSNRALIGRTSVYNVLAGPEFFPLRHHKITPWAHFLFGQGYYRDSIPPFGGFPAHVNAAYAFWRVEPASTGTTSGGGRFGCLLLITTQHIFSMAQISPGSPTIGSGSGSFIASVGDREAAGCARLRHLV